MSDADQDNVKEKIKIHAKDDSIKINYFYFLFFFDVVSYFNISNVILSNIPNSTQINSWSSNKFFFSTASGLQNHRLQDLDLSRLNYPFHHHPHSFHQHRFF